MSTDRSLETRSGQDNSFDLPSEAGIGGNDKVAAQKIASVFGRLNKEVDRESVERRVGESVDVTDPTVNLGEASEKAREDALYIATKRQTLREVEEELAKEGLAPELPVTEQPTGTEG